jgi:tRNA pseudouridine38-40 synthase
MQQAAKLLVGEHDFAAFQASGSPAKCTVRRLLGASCKRLGDLVWITFEADAFLYQMARIMVSCLQLVGTGRHSIEWMRGIVEGCDRKAAPPPAPPQGLCLINVRYN